MAEPIRTVEERDANGLRPGWLQRVFDAVVADMATWPEWMRREITRRRAVSDGEEGQ